MGCLERKIEIVVNKESSKGIECEVIKKILGDYEIVGKIKYGEENIELSYSKILQTINYIPKVGILDRLFANRRVEVSESNRIPMSKKEAILNAN